MLKLPLSAYKYYNITPKKLQHVGGRAYLADNLFIVKYDEQFRANSLSFISNLFAIACGLKVPNMILSNKYSVGVNGFDGDEKMLQIMDYIPNWEDYSQDHRRSISFVKELARLLAYDLVVGNFDRFLFITRYFDNIIFANEPEWEDGEIFVIDKNGNLDEDEDACGG